MDLNAAWSDLPQDLRQVPKHEVVEALRSLLVRAAAGPPELKFRAGAEEIYGKFRKKYIFFFNGLGYYI
jgi:hypothetical protein